MSALTSPIRSITGFVDPKLAGKADRFFDQSLRSIAIELLQNSRRAGARNVAVVATPLGEGVFTVVVRDDGRGLEDPAKLVGLGSSDWDSLTEAVEDPAGCGFFALCAHGATVRSRDWEVVLTRATFLGKESVPVLPAAPIEGFEITFTLRDIPHTTENNIRHAIQAASRFGALNVSFNGTPLERQDFFEDVLLTKDYHGVRIGVFAGRRDGGFNFHGMVVGGPSRDTIQNGEEVFSVNFDVLEASRLRLTLPQRDRVVQNEFYTALLAESRRAIYEHIATLPSHSLSFASYQEARSLGVKLNESAALMPSYVPDSGCPRNQSYEKAKALPKHPLICDIVDRGIGQAIAWAAGLNPETFKFSLLDGGHDHAGYQWYDALPHITEARFVIDGKVQDEDRSERFDPMGKIPASLAIRLTIEQKGVETKAIELPTNLIIPACDSGDSVEFLIPHDNPFKDKRAQDGLFDILEEVFFEYDDNGDSYDSQYEDFQRDLRTTLTQMFGGRKQAALQNLQDAVDDVGTDLEEAGLKDIRLKLVGGRWEVVDMTPKKGKARKK